MSPSEVIIGLYIMPEDASFGAFSFSLKTFFFHYKGEKNVFISLPLWNSGPGWGPWPCHAVPTGPGDARGSRRELEGATLDGKHAICPWL